MPEHQGSRGFRGGMIAAVTAAFVCSLLFLYGAFWAVERPAPVSVGSGLNAPAASAPVSLTARPAGVAGQFYPADPGELRRLLAEDLRAADPPPAGRPRIVISPHAGYDYSGRVAAFAFKPLVGSGYRRAVIIGRSHQARFDGVAAEASDAWATPLGDVAVDRDFIDRLAAEDAEVRVDPGPHVGEHSIEVMVPFIVETLGPDATIVPLLFGSEDYGAAEKLASALAKLIDDDTVIIISTDLAHYPSAADAAELDARTAEAILSNDAGEFRARLARLMELGKPQVQTLACGEIAVAAALYLSRDLGLSPQLLKLADSSAYAPDTKDRAVGYAAVAFNDPAASGGRELDAAEQQQAVDLARKTLDASFGGLQPPVVPAAAVFSEKRGVFVTLKKNGQLRGCIGVFEPDKPLGESIRSMALAAAFEDKRFQPLGREELAGLEIEISVLSPRVRVYDPALVEAGRHGVYLAKGAASGVFLPQVAKEQGWGPEQLLSELCLQKAGLEKDCWRSPDAELYVFTAQVFGEQH